MPTSLFDKSTTTRWCNSGLRPSFWCVLCACVMRCAEVVANTCIDLSPRAPLLALLSTTDAISRSICRKPFAFDSQFKTSPWCHWLKLSQNLFEEMAISSLLYGNECGFTYLNDDSILVPGVIGCTSDQCAAKQIFYNSGSVGAVHNSDYSP